MGEKIDEEMTKVLAPFIHKWSSKRHGRMGASLLRSIKLRGVRDLAFLVLRKEGSLMHFAEVAPRKSPLISADLPPPPPSITSL